MLGVEPKAAPVNRFAEKRFVMARHSNASRSATLAKGLKVLDFLGAQQSPQALRQITTGLGMTKPTAHRLLATLIDHGMVRFESSDNTYRLGMRLFELSRKVWQDFDLRGCASAEMRKLHKATGETISLAILTPEGGIYIDELQSSHPLREQPRVGKRVSAWTSAIGKALVSGLSRDERARLELGDESRIIAEGRYADLADLNRHLDLVNARGYAIDVDEDVQGISGVAAPIVDNRGVTVAAIGLSGSSSRLDRETLHRLGPDVIEATRLASLQAGGAPRPVSHAPMPADLPAPECRVLADAGNLIGESPTLGRDGCTVYWVDICRPGIFAHDLKSGETAMHPQSEMITSVSDAGGGMLVSSLSGVRRIDLESGETLEILADPEADLPANRYNDGKCDAQGRFWVGSLAFSLEGGAGSLYRIDPDGSVAVVERGLTLPNGIAWSRDASCMYLVETAERCVYAYDFDLESGTAKNRRTLISFDTECPGSPDGMDVDEEGDLWIAMWDGWSVRRYSPEGVLREIRSVPFPRPTSCLCLGGDWNAVAVTSARIRVSDELLLRCPTAGALVALDR